MPAARFYFCITLPILFLLCMPVFLTGLAANHKAVISYFTSWDNEATNQGHSFPLWQTFLWNKLSKLHGSQEKSPGKEGRRVGRRQPGGILAFWRSLGDWRSSSNWWHWTTAPPTSQVRPIFLKSMPPHSTIWTNTNVYNYFEIE